MSKTIEGLWEQHCEANPSNGVAEGIATIERAERLDDQRIVDDLVKVVWNIMGPPCVNDDDLRRIKIETWEEAHDTIWAVIRELRARGMDRHWTEQFGTTLAQQSRLATSFVGAA